MRIKATHYLTINDGKLPMNCTLNTNPVCWFVFIFSCLYLVRLSLNIANQWLYYELFTCSHTLRTLWTNRLKLDTLHGIVDSSALTPNAWRYLQRLNKVMKQFNVTPKVNKNACTSFSELHISSILSQEFFAHQVYLHANKRN